MEDYSLEINTKLFKAGGVVGRWDFFKNSMIHFAFTVALILPFLVHKSLNPQMKFIILGVSFLGLFPVMFGSLVNIFKRIRDIRGKTENQVAFQFGYIILSAIPIVGLFLNLFLYFKKGAVTGFTRNPHETPREVKRAA